MPIKNKRISAFIIIGSVALAMGTTEPVVFAQGAAPAGATGVTNPNDPSSAVGNNSGGTAPGPVYSGPAAASGANSPPVNSGITDPKTGANNDTIPSDSTAPGAPVGNLGSPSTGMRNH